MLARRPIWRSWLWTTASFFRSLGEIKRGAHLVEVDVILRVIQVGSRCSEMKWEETGRESLEVFRWAYPKLIERSGTRPHFDTDRQHLLFLNPSLEYYKVLLSLYVSLLRLHFSVLTWGYHVRLDGAWSCLGLSMLSSWWSELVGLDVSVKELFSPLLGATVMDLVF